MTAGAILVIALSVASTLAAGLACDPAALRRALGTRATWAALAGNLVVVPLIAWLVLPAIVSGPAALGLLFVAAAPGGGIGPLLALLGRGDASFAGALFLVLSLAGMMIALVVTVVLDTGLADMLRATGLVIGSALAPLLVGIQITRRMPDIARGLLPWASRLGALLLVAAVIAFSVRHGGNVSASMLGAAGLLAGASILVGCLAARGASRAVAIAVVQISLVRNVALTLVVVTGLGAAPDAIMAVLTYALVMLVAGGLISAASLSLTAQRKPPLSRK